MAPSVFVSYSRSSEAIVRGLADDIRALGREVWFDENLTGGQDWWDQILATIRDHDLFVFVLTPESLSSTACQREYTYAAALGKPILPVLASKDVKEHLLPPAIAKVQYVDYREQSREAFRDLAKALVALPPPGPLPEPLPTPPEVPISYLGGIAEKVNSQSPVDFAGQSALVFELKQALSDPSTINDARSLLVALRARRDVFAVIASEVDELLRRASPQERNVSEAASRAAGSSSAVVALASSGAPSQGVGATPSKLGGLFVIAQLAGLWVFAGAAGIQFLGYYAGPFAIPASIVMGVFTIALLVLGGMTKSRTLLRPGIAGLVVSAASIVLDRYGVVAGDLSLFVFAVLSAGCVTIAAFFDSLRQRFGAAAH